MCVFNDKSLTRPSYTCNTIYGGCSRKKRRRNVNSLSAGEKRRLVSAMNRLIEEGKYVDIASIYGVAYEVPCPEEAPEEASEEAAEEPSFEERVEEAAEAKAAKIAADSGVDSIEVIAEEGDSSKYSNFTDAELWVEHSKIRNEEGDSAARAFYVSQIRSK